MLKKLGFILVLILVPLTVVLANTFVAIQSGSWFSPSTWGTESAIPGADDYVTISTGKIVTMDGASNVSVNRLDLSGGVSGKGVLLGPDGMACTLRVQEYIHLTYSVPTSCGAKIQNGSGGFLYVEIGGDLQIMEDCEYYSNRTTFTAIGSSVYDNICILNTYPTAVTNTIFDTANFNIIIEVWSSIDLNGSIWGSFENSKISTWSSVGFSNCAFRNCTLMISTGHNTFNNCHFSSISADKTVYFTGPVAILDSYNTFENISLEGSGSLWGNVGVTNDLVLYGDLAVPAGTSINPGDGGGLNIFLRGNLSVQGSYNVTMTYFNGSRPIDNPQVISAGVSSINGNFLNMNPSHLALATDLSFTYSAATTFNAGNLNLNGYQLSHVTLRGGNIQVPPFSSIYASTIESSVFNGDDILILSDCVIADNIIAFNCAVHVNVALRGAWSSAIQIPITGNLSIGVGAVIEPGVAGSLGITLDGSLNSSGTINFVPITFIGGNHQVGWTGSSNFSGNIINNCSQLSFDPLFGGLLDMHGANLIGNATSRFTMLWTIYIQNANLIDAIFVNSEILGDALLFLGNSSLNNCSFAMPVTINGPVGLIGTSLASAGFLSDLTIGSSDNASLQGCSDIASEFTVMGALTTSGNIIAGDNGTMNANLYGNITKTSPTTTWSGTINLLGNAERTLRFDIPLNATYTEPIIRVSGSSNVVLIGVNTLPGAIISTGSSLNVASGATLTLNPADQFFTGEWSVDGSCTNTRTYADNTYLGFVNLSATTTIHPDLAPTYITCTYYRSEPNHLPNNTGETWLVMPNVNPSVLSANMIFYSNSIEDLSPYDLYESADNGNTWSIANGTPDYSNGIYSLAMTNRSLVNVRYAVSSFNREWKNSAFLPAANSTQPQSPTFNWNAFYEPTGYVMTVYDTTDQVIYQSDMLTEPGLLLPVQLSQGQSYKWQVRAYSLYLGNNNYSEMIPFDIAMPTWSQTALIAPLGDTTPLKPSFSWNPLEDGAVYQVKVSTDPGMDPLAYTGSVISETFLQIDLALAPETNFYWTVTATGPTSGEVISDPGSFNTRIAITTNLPTTGETIPGGTVMFYVPAFVQNLLPGEELTVTPSSSTHFIASCTDGHLSIVTPADWNGIETVNVLIEDGFTTLSVPIEIISLGSPTNIGITATYTGEGTMAHLTWAYVSGANYYGVYHALSPEGPWDTEVVYTQDLELSPSSPEPAGFYRVKAFTGTMPTAGK